MRQINHFGILAINKENIRKKSRDIKANLDLGIPYFVLNKVSWL